MIGLRHSSWHVLAALRLSFSHLKSGLGFSCGLVSNPSHVQTGRLVRPQPV
jgi:hypothetical protein